MSIYSEYWSKAPQGQYKAPQAGFQTVWVQTHQQQRLARLAALRAQWIEAGAIF